MANRSVQVKTRQHRAYPVTNLASLVFSTTGFKSSLAILGVALLLAAAGCQRQAESTASVEAPVATLSSPSATPFVYEADRFEDIQVLRLPVPGFDELDLNTKTLLYYLYNASLSGRDIMWDQNYRHNLKIRQLLEAIIRFYPGDKTQAPFTDLHRYAKQMWFANGIHHHYSNSKFTPDFTVAQWRAMALEASAQPQFPIPAAELTVWLQELAPVLFDPTVAAKKLNKSEQADKVADSATNFYRNLTQQEVENYYAAIINKDDPTPISHGLNSQLVKENGAIVERVWKVSGMYSPAIERIVYWLEQAIPFAENAAQKQALELLVKFYRSGDLKDFDEYSIAWVKDTESQVDLISGFIEVYNDPIAYRGAYEAVLSVRDPIATRRIATIATAAQWFEDNSPIMDAHKKPNVVGISAKAINVVVEAGATSPNSPIGINLPNANWIRAQHGSKSVSLTNIKDAQDAVGGKAMEEFGHSAEIIQRSKTYGELASKLRTDLHEVIGHASGKINAGVGTPKQTLKQYGSTIEEARADLVALYYIVDPKLIELGVIDSDAYGKTTYDSFILNGLMLQLQRIKPGDSIEQDHMRNRQMIAQWVYEKGKAENVIELLRRDNKTYAVVNDYTKLRSLFGQLLREVQRITSEGDYAAAQQLVETYGVKVDSELHREVLERFAKLDIAPYKGFINPKLIAVKEGDKIVDVKIEYPSDFTAQMLEYSQDWSFLPVVN